MTGLKNNQRISPKVIRTELAVRLRERSAEIENKIVACTRDLSEPVGDKDPSYLEGLQSAVSEALNYGLECIEEGGGWSAPIPPAAIRQACRAAREGVRLDTVMRRYAAGNKVLEEFVVAEGADIPSEVLCQILRDQGPQVDRLMEAVAAEYERELEQAARSPIQKHAEQVLQLLSDDELESGIDLDYDFDIWHVGMILTGPHPEGAARVLAERLGYRLLHIVRDHEVVWVWLGSTRQPEMVTLVRSLSEGAPAETSMAIGEPRKGLEGWRLTHREAQVALQEMRRNPARVARCRDVVLRASILRDETLVRSLLDTYLTPLEKYGKRAETLRETLRAYFSAGGNAAAAAPSLGVNRHTVQQRIRTIEKALGQPLYKCNAELQVALQIDELNDFADQTAG